MITGDHTNQTYYSEYQKQMNRFAVSLILYSPNPEYHLNGVSQDYAQQIDIYPTTADLIGYHKKIRSWGRSLVSDKKENYIIVNSDGIQEQFIIGNQIYRFDGKNITGVYALNDLGMENDLKKQINPKDLKKAEMICRAWYQDYMEKIIDRKLGIE